MKVNQNNMVSEYNEFEEMLINVNKIKETINMKVNQKNIVVKDL